MSTKKYRMKSANIRVDHGVLNSVIDRLEERLDTLEEAVRLNSKAGLEVCEAVAALQPKH